LEETAFTGDNYADRVLDWIVFSDGGRLTVWEWQVDRERKSSSNKLQQDVQHGQCERD
jgi:hypothetical protein